MKQTAVELYEKEINSLLEKYESKEISTLDFIIIKHNLFDRAKEMEKQQIGEAVDKTNSKWKSQKAEIILTGEQYYNEKFNK